MTIDGLVYTYNGIGEYWLILSDTFELQGRMSQVLDANQVPRQASIWSAVAAKDTSGNSGDGSSTVSSVRFYAALNTADNSQYNFRPMSPLF